MAATSVGAGGASSVFGSRNSGRGSLLDGTGSQNRTEYVAPAEPRSPGSLAYRRYTSKIPTSAGYGKDVEKACLVTGQTYGSCVTTTCMGIDEKKTADGIRREGTNGRSESDPDLELSLYGTRTYGGGTPSNKTTVVGVDGTIRVTFPGVSEPFSGCVGTEEGAVFTKESQSGNKTTLGAGEVVHSERCDSISSRFNQLSGLAPALKVGDRLLGLQATTRVFPYDSRDRSRYVTIHVKSAGDMIGYSFPMGSASAATIKRETDHNLVVVIGNKEYKVPFKEGNELYVVDAPSVYRPADVEAGFAYAAIGIGSICVLSMLVAARSRIASGVGVCANMFKCAHPEREDNGGTPVV